MSKESVQFVEMIRQAVSKKREDTRNREHTRAMYCEICGTTTTHTITVQGLYEYYKCVHCNIQRWFKVG
jgi:hypothetical protein